MPKCNWQCVFRCYVGWGDHCIILAGAGSIQKTDHDDAESSAVTSTSHRSVESMINLNTCYGTAPGVLCVCGLTLNVEFMSRCRN